MSSYLTFDESYLRDIGGEFTAKEICHQPEMWRKAFVSLQERRAEVDAFLQPLLNKPDLRVILTGAGTSAFAGEVAAPHLAQVIGKRFEAVSTTDIVASPSEHLAEQVPTLVISFARSGNSPESVAALNLSNQVLNECYHLILTCNSEGELAQASKTNDNAFCLLMPEGTNDRSFAMTSSFTSMLLTAICIFDRSEGISERVEKVCSATEAFLSEQAEEMKAIAVKDCRRVVFLGSGCLKGLAQEAALKLLELTAGKVVAIFDSPLGFRHGPKSIVDNNTLIFQFMTNDNYTRLYDQDLLSEIRNDNQAMQIIAITDKRDEQSQNATSTISTKTKLDVESVYLSFPFIALAQMFAFFKSEQLGITPDNPCPTGEVNRVVQGVAIYPYDKRN